MFLQKASQSHNNFTSTFRSSWIHIFTTARNVQVSCILSSLWPIPLVCENVQVLNFVLLSSAIEHGCAGLMWVCQPGTKPHTVLYDDSAKVEKLESRGWFGAELKELDCSFRVKCQLASFLSFIFHLESLNTLERAVMAAVLSALQECAFEMKFLIATAYCTLLCTIK